MRGGGAEELAELGKGGWVGTLESQETLRWEKPAEAQETLSWVETTGA